MVALQETDMVIHQQKLYSGTQKEIIINQEQIILLIQDSLEMVIL